MFIQLARKSLLNRVGSVILTVLAISLSVFALLGVNHLREQAKTSFAHTISEVDLIVGAPTGRINLLLSTVFRLGNPSRPVSWQSFQQFAEHPKVAWAIPLALGDSHKGFRVLGTTPDFYQHYHYGQKHSLEMDQGHFFGRPMEIVLGSEVAHSLEYQIGDSIVIAHGVGQSSFHHHDQDPFRVVGILQPTGTPVDQALYVSLDSLAAIHGTIEEHEAHEEHEGHEAHSTRHQSRLSATKISGFFLGLHSRMDAFRLQGEINNQTKEPLMAIIPGVALMELWQVVGTLENILSAVAGLVLLAALLGLGAMLLSSIRERDKEIALLRVIGASPLFLVGLIQCEAFIISLSGVLIGSGALFVVLFFAQTVFSANLGVALDVQLFTASNMYLMVTMLLAAMVSAAIPSLLIYRKALKFR